MNTSDDRRLTDPFKDDLHRLIEHVGAIKESIARIEVQMVKVEDHHKTLYGVNGSPGLSTIVDRLNESEKSRKWLWTAIGSLGLKTLWDVLTTHRGS